MIPVGATFEVWFGIDNPPGHVAGGVRPDERIPDSDSRSEDAQSTPLSVPASDFNMLYDRIEQTTNGWGVVKLDTELFGKSE